MIGVSLNQTGSPDSKSGIKCDTQFLRRHFLQVVIQEIATGRYWQRTGLWTYNRDMATAFQSCSAALEQATHLQLQNVQLVLTREIKECEVIPIKTSFRSGASEHV